MSSSPSLNNVVYACVGCIILIVAIEQLLPPRTPTVKQPEAGQEEMCQGEPIYVSYSYAGGMLDPWECKVQCDDQKQRYIMYTNGQATPCEALPGCLDWGEDYGVLCVPPGASTGTGESLEG